MRANSKTGATVVVLGWLTTPVILSLPPLTLLGGHGPQLALVLLAPVMGVVGALGHTIFLRRRSNSAADQTSRWLSIGTCTLIGYMLVSTSVAVAFSRWDDSISFVRFSLFVGLVPAFAIAFALDRVVLKIEKSNKRLQSDAKKRRA